MEGTKKELRAFFKERRSKLTGSEVDLFNDGLLTQFQQFDWRGLEYVHTFLPIKKQIEPDTYRLIDWLRKAFPELKLVISKSDLKTNLMEHFVWEDDLAFEVNLWGIEEPIEGKSIVPQQLDAVIVPLLAFDQTGHRVGFGKGFYDRFLAACRPDCLIIGLSFFAPIAKIKDINPFDIKLDFCLTPERIHKFENNRT
ncbi:5-formyltetrahydrofolate cyclo-ligase [Albibacterium profundi]|uniref:5-formyltetrahydrofolate cyclo-ligase n=1 Tax=Albibacterium profundi TaxID=3134906 RepID=A0ABV5CDB8_9SPHI